MSKRFFCLFFRRDNGMPCLGRCGFVECCCLRSLCHRLEFLRRFHPTFCAWQKGSKNRVTFLISGSGG